MLHICERVNDQSVQSLSSSVKIKLLRHAWKTFCLNQLKHTFTSPEISGINRDRKKVQDLKPLTRKQMRSLVCLIENDRFVSLKVLIDRFNEETTSLTCPRPHIEIYTCSLLQFGGSEEAKEALLKLVENGIDIRNSTHHQELRTLQTTVVHQSSQISYANVHSTHRKSFQQMFQMPYDQI